MFNHKLWTDTKRTGLVYFTIGMLMCVWVAVWYFAFARTGEHPMTNNTWFWLAGFFMTGLTLMLIGGVQGAIHRTAQKAEVQLSARTADDAAAAGAAVPHMMAAGAPMVPPAPAMMAPPPPMPGVVNPGMVPTMNQGGVPPVPPAPHGGPMRAGI